MRSFARRLPHEAGEKFGPKIHCNEQKADFGAIRQPKQGVTFSGSRLFAVFAVRVPDGFGFF